MCKHRPNRLMSLGACQLRLLIAEVPGSARSEPPAHNKLVVRSHVREKQPINSRPQRPTALAKGPTVDKTDCLRPKADP